MQTLSTLIISFIGTNLDDLFVLTLLFSQVGKDLKKSDILLGQFLGIATLVLIALITNLGLSFLPVNLIGWLGLLPIFLGVKTWLDYRKGDKAASSEEPEPQLETTILGNRWTGPFSFLRMQVFNVAAITLADGADNLGVYIPLFKPYSNSQLVMMGVVFTTMVALWCFLADKLANFPLIRNKLVKYQHITVPIIFIGLGIYILVENHILF